MHDKTLRAPTEIRAETYQEAEKTAMLPDGFYLLKNDRELHVSLVKLYSHPDFNGVRHVAFGPWDGASLIPIRDLCEDSHFFPADIRIGATATTTDSLNLLLRDDQARPGELARAVISTDQPDALQLADELGRMLNQPRLIKHNDSITDAADDTLRQQHAEIERLTAERDTLAQAVHILRAGADKMCAELGALRAQRQQVVSAGYGVIVNSYPDHGRRSVDGVAWTKLVDAIVAVTTAPQSPREVERLTDQQLDVIEEGFSNEFGLEAKYSRDFARAVESACAKAWGLKLKDPT